MLIIIFIYAIFSISGVISEDAIPDSISSGDLLKNLIKGCDGHTGNCQDDDQSFLASEDDDSIEALNPGVLHQERRDSGCQPYTHACVPYYQCVDGVINTSGTGLIDVRSKVFRECTDPENPSIPGVCCRIPGATTPEPYVPCPSNEICVERRLCNSDGTINTDGSGIINVRLHTRFQPCRLNTNNQNLGVCCKPEPLDRCPQYQSCVAEYECSGTNEPERCFIDRNNYLLGVCCEYPDTEYCPDDSVCVPESECRGEIWDRSRNFVSYRPNGDWYSCTGPDGQNRGVCCRRSQVTDPRYVPAEECGVRNYGSRQRSSGTLGKNSASFGEFPWQAILFFKNYTYKCGASLVGDRWLITGAHCVNGYTHRDFRVRLGEWQVDSYDEPLPYLDAEVAAIITHPDFNSDNLHNNIAIIELAAPVSLQYHVNFICLPSYHQMIRPGSMCVASGWGKDAFRGNYQAILNQVDVPFVEHGRCEELLRETRLGRFFRLHESFMCAGGEENKDACTGDGGGPLACKDSVTGKYYLQGITSWGIDCGQKDVPGVYADVRYFDNWINNYIYL